MLQLESLVKKFTPAPEVKSLEEAVALIKGQGWASATLSAPAAWWRITYAKGESGPVNAVQLRFVIKNSAGQKVAVQLAKPLDYAGDSRGFMSFPNHLYLTPLAAAEAFLFYSDATNQLVGQLPRGVTVKINSPDKTLIKSVEHAKEVIGGYI